jgi:hypothetical protein
MKEYWTYIVVLSLFLLFIIGTGILCVLFRSCGLDSKNSPAAAPPPATPTSSSQVLTPLGVGDPAMLPVAEIVTGIPGGPGPLLSAGTGTTTLRAKSPFNDILIAETGSEYASLRNARYSMWPYPGEIRFKEVYIILPDVYEPIFPGYSDNQFVISSDGQKQVVLYLRHKGSLRVGADVEVYVQAPIETDEGDHPMTLLESSDSGAVYSLVQKSEEVLVEVMYKARSDPSQASARAALLSAIEGIELEW